MLYGFNTGLSGYAIELLEACRITALSRIEQVGVYDIGIEETNRGVELDETGYARE